MEIRYERNADGMFDRTPSGSWRERFVTNRRGRDGKYVYDFVPTSEAQALLDEYSSLIGRDMQVKHFGEKQIKEAKKNVPGLDFEKNTRGGVFQPRTPDRVFLQKDAPLSTLAHELEHAADPNVSQQAQDQFVRNLEAGVPVSDGSRDWRNERADIFNYYTQGPLRTYENELLAEKAASDYEKSRGFDYRDIGLYPSHYLDKYMGNWETSPAWHHYLETTDPNNMEEIGFSRARPYQRAQQEYVEDLRSDPVFREAVGDYYNKAETIYNRYKGTEF